MDSHLETDEIGELQHHKQQKESSFRRASMQLFKASVNSINKNKPKTKKAISEISVADSINHSSEQSQSDLKKERISETILDDIILNQMNLFQLPQPVSKDWAQKGDLEYLPLGVQAIGSAPQVVSHHKKFLHTKNPNEVSNASLSNYYFEQATVMERKVEPLPLHLLNLLSSKKNEEKSEQNLPPANIHAPFKSTSLTAVLE